MGMRAPLCPALTWCAPRHIAHSHHPPAHTCCSRTHNHQPAERDNQSNSNQNKFHAHTLALARLRVWRTSIELTTNTGGAGQTMPAPGNPRSKRTHPTTQSAAPTTPCRRRGSTCNQWHNPQAGNAWLARLFPSRAPATPIRDAEATTTRGRRRWERIHCTPTLSPIPTTHPNKHVSSLPRLNHNIVEGACAARAASHPLEFEAEVAARMPQRQ